MKLLKVPFKRGLETSYKERNINKAFTLMCIEGGVKWKAGQCFWNPLLGIPLNVFRHRGTHDLIDKTLFRYHTKKAFNTYIKEATLKDIDISIITDGELKIVLNTKDKQVIEV